MSTRSKYFSSIVSFTLYFVHLTLISAKCILIFSLKGMFFRLGYSLSGLAFQTQIIRNPKMQGKWKWSQGFCYIVWLIILTPCRNYYSQSSNLLTDYNFWPRGKISLDQQPF
jgi:hypothetical protein